ncbi:MAG: tetratricopeptide repeat protein [Planctomycetes bacterium]|nr:tetratricopeptide repeat protein [Planctomycetota bacterium]
MIRLPMSLLILSIVTIGTAEEPKAKTDAKPQYERMLKGEDAKKFQELWAKVSAHQRAGRTDDLLKALDEVVALRSRVQGPDHWETIKLKWLVDRERKIATLPAEKQAGWRNALADNRRAADLESKGRYAQALPLRVACEKWCRDVLGEEHPDTAISYNNVASNLDDQGKAAEAEPLYRKALAINRKVLGEEHPDTATSYNNVAMNLNAQGKAAEAEPLNRKALAINRKVLGEEHPDTATSYNNVAMNLDAQGKAAEAEPLLRKALTINRKVLGEEHPDTALSYNNVAFNLKAQGKAAEAEPLNRKALAIRVKVHGEEHPDTAQSYNNVAFNLKAQGKAAEAEPLYRKALAINRKVLGEEHPHTATSYNNVASNLNTQGKAVDSVEFLEACMHSYEAARLNIAAQGLDRAEFGISKSPYPLLAVTRAQLKQPAAAWSALEANLARGLLDQLGSGKASRLTTDEETRRRELTGQLRAIAPRLLKLVSSSKRNDAEQQELDNLLTERSKVSGEMAKLAIALSQREVADLNTIQSVLPTDAAFATWVDVTTVNGQQHWACVLHSTGEPRWEKLPGSGLKGEWTREDADLPNQLRSAIIANKDAAEVAWKLHAQRLAPIEKHLVGVKTLYVAGINQMAGIPVEALTDKYSISYVSSGTFLARLKNKPAQTSSGILALGDPIFGTQRKIATDLPPGGLLIMRVVPGGSAAKAGLRDGDTIVRYADTDLTSLEQFSKLYAANQSKIVEIKVWRSGEAKLAIRELASGSLGVVINKRPAREAIADRRKTEELLLASRGPDLAELPGTRVELNNLAKLFEKNATILVDSDASEQKLEDLRMKGDLSKFRYLHFGTHGAANNTRAFESVLYLSQDNLPKELISQPNSPFINGELSAREVLEYWKLDAELVTLSACETALGKTAGGDGLLGFAQAFLTASARSVCLSLWKVDDTATALLMNRFYQNLLGKRDGLTKPMPKAEALREAKNWLRNLSSEEALMLTATMTNGVACGERGKEVALRLVVPKETKTDHPAKDSKPFGHPKFWAAFILIGDPN